MTWIRTRALAEPEVAQAVRDAMEGYPPEYAPSRRHQRKLPEAVMNDSIVRAHSLMPKRCGTFLPATGPCSIHSCRSRAATTR